MNIMCEDEGEIVIEGKFEGVYMYVLFLPLFLSLFPLWG